MNTILRNLSIISASAALAAGAFAAPASAGVPWEGTFDGVCDFPLIISGSGHEQQVLNKEFKDKDGNLVRVLSAGKGQDLTFTNGNHPEISFSTRANGAVSMTRPNGDGSSTVVNMGHNVIMMYATDVPPGPSTTLYTGRVVYTVDSQSVFTIIKESGAQLDICAALSPDS